MDKTSIQGIDDSGSILIKITSLIVLFFLTNIEILVFNTF